MAICDVDMDDAYYLGTSEDGVYFDTCYVEVVPGIEKGWYWSSLIDCNSGHWCDDYQIDQGPYATEAEALFAGLYAASDWLSDNNITRGWRGDYKRLTREFKRAERRA